MLVGFMDIRTRFMLSLAINTSPGATLKVCRVFSKIYEEMATDGGTGADDFIFGDAAAWFGDCELIVLSPIFELFQPRLRHDCL
jgi:hypothetical protein